MKRFGVPVPCAIALVLFLSIVPLLPLAATAESQQTSEAQSATPAPGMAAEESPAAMMGNMMGSMMEANLKAYISLLGKPEVAEKLASFTKSYYDALVAKGFTKEEALRIVIGASPVNIGK